MKHGNEDMRGTHVRGDSAPKDGKDSGGNDQEAQMEAYGMEVVMTVGTSMTSSPWRLERYG